VRNSYHSPTADLPTARSRRLVLAGPVEATAIGNMLVQLIAGGQLQLQADGRDLVRRSFPPELYEPRPFDAWEEAYQRYLRPKG